MSEDYLRMITESDENAQATVTFTTDTTTQIIPNPTVNMNTNAQAWNGIYNPNPTINAYDRVGRGWYGTLLPDNSSQATTNLIQIPLSDADIDRIAERVIEKLRVSANLSPGKQS